MAKSEIAFPKLSILNSSESNSYWQTQNIFVGHGRHITEFGWMSGVLDSPYHLCFINSWAPLISLTNFVSFLDSHSYVWDWISDFQYFHYKTFTLLKRGTVYSSYCVRVTFQLIKTDLILLWKHDQLHLIHDSYILYHYKVPVNKPWTWLLITWIRHIHVGNWIYGFWWPTRV